MDTKECMVAKSSFGFLYAVTDKSKRTFLANLVIIGVAGKCCILKIRKQNESCSVCLVRQVLPTSVTGAVAPQEAPFQPQPARLPSQAVSPSSSPRGSSGALFRC